MGVLALQRSRMLSGLCLAEPKSVTWTCFPEPFSTIIFDQAEPTLERDTMTEPNGRRRPYRNRMEITAGILDIAKNGSRKTRIMYLGNLSFDLLQKYLDMLVNVGLLEQRNNDDRMYVATEKGRKFLEDFNELQKYSTVAEEKKRTLEQSLNPVA